MRYDILFSDMDYELQLDDYGNAPNVQDAAGNSWRYDYGFNSKLLAAKTWRIL